jgi:isopentenyl-diphosphate delta-isomerase type 1
MYTEEIVDEFDDDGAFVGTIKKSEAHNTGAWHKAAHVFIVNSQNKLLLQQRAADKYRDAGKWQHSASGHVSAGEDSRTAAIRETKEELGITISPTELKNLFQSKEIYKSPKVFDCEICDVFIAKKDIKATDIKLTDGEVTAVKFVTVDEFFEMVDARDPNLAMSHEDIYYQIKPILLHKLYL